MSHRNARRNALRLQSTIQRVEQQPYDFGPRVRQPRLSGSAIYLCCQLGSTLNAATGSFPSLTPGVALNTQVYMPNVNANGNTNTFGLTAIGSTNSTILNYYNTAFNAGKTTEVIPSGLPNVFCTVVQDC